MQNKNQQLLRKSRQRLCGETKTPDLEVCSDLGEYVPMCMSDWLETKSQNLRIDVVEYIA